MKRVLDELFSRMAGHLIGKSAQRRGKIAMQAAGSGSDLPSTAIFATLLVTASGHLEDLDEIVLN